VIAATQKPSSAVIGPLVKANFPVRLVGRVVSSEDARVAAGIGGTGAERLSGRGDFLAISNLGTLRFQAAYVPREDLEQLAQRVRN
jgi:S-DNA-T family DNA segregation ATPase FtsK/SpoIIIE